MKKFNLFLIALFLLVFLNAVHGQGVVINEILTSNTTVNKDEDGTYQDWIELYNTGISPVNLLGYGLSDDPTLIYKWVFPNVSLGSGQYLLIWCSNKNRAIPGNPLHTNFKLSSSGEIITLTNGSGTTVDFVPKTITAQNISLGRLPNGTGSFVFFPVVTPQATNSTVGYHEVLSPPTFSKDSGFLTSGFDLTLSSSTVGSTILYTLDGSEPKETNLGGTTYSYKNQYPYFHGQVTGPLLTQSFRTLQYTTPIAIVDRSPFSNKLAAISTTTDFDPFYIPQAPIFKGTVVRAKLIKPGALESKTATKTYYICPQGASKYTLPVVSLSLDENKLFDYYTGINVAGVDFDNWRIANPTLNTPDIGDVCNFFRHGINNEAVANMTYFVKGKEVLNQDVGIRIHGGSSRVAQNRSLSLYARSDYGNDALNFKFFSDKSHDSFTGLVLHNSGNDYNQTLFRDAFCHELMKSLNILTKGYQPAITLINGEYWGIMSLRDKIEADYFKREYNIPSTEIDVLQDGNKPIEGNNLNYLDLLNYIANNPLSIQSNFDYIKTRLDPENFKDYCISEIFLENTDWPSNNIVYWRKKTAAYEPNASFGSDGRWRWAAHDMDDTFAITNSNINFNTLAAATDPNGPGYPNPEWATFMLRKMLENNGYKIEFINRFADLLNTSFLTSRMLSKMAEMKAVIAPEMPQQFARWSAPYDNGDWTYFLNNQTNFINQRPAFQRNHIRAQFGISKNIDATLDVSEANRGYIKMNTIDIKIGTPSITSNPYPWTGIYFSGIPVTIKAIANPGFTFSHWTGASTSTNPEITITSNTDFNVTAVFVPETVATSRPIYYWMMNASVTNNVPLETLNTTYKTGDHDGVLQYQSCLVGYPFVATDLIHWRKASMERRNSPTDINYIPEANNNIAFNTSDMKGLQIREPLQNGGLENTMVFNFSTLGYKDISFSFAAINESTPANAIIVDYSINSGTPVWITSGMVSTSLPLTTRYQLFHLDFSAITTINNNVDFKVRLRFTGANMTVDTGAQITFNNIAVNGTPLLLAVSEIATQKFLVSPNPFSDSVTVMGINDMHSVFYKLYAIDGKLIKTGILEDAKINLDHLPQGIYLLQLSSEEKIETKKIIKK